MQIMYIQHEFGRPTPLMAGETAYHTEENLQAITHYCAPLSRGFYVPFFGPLSAEVTDRRVRVGCRFFPILYSAQSISLWFPGKEPEANADTLVSVSDTQGFYGPCLELLGRNPQRRTGLFSTPELRVRVYGPDLNTLANTIALGLTAQAQENRSKNGQLIPAPTARGRAGPSTPPPPDRL